MQNNHKQLVIMVVEDEGLLLQAITRKLNFYGIKPIACGSGAQAVSYFSTLQELPDAIWLDYYLGDMEGDEFMQKLRANKRWIQVPVIVVSNSASDEKVKEMQDLGIKRYLIKAEHRLDDIITIIKTILKDQDQENK